MTTAPAGYEPSAPPVFDGGDEQDRAELLKAYYDFRIANDHLDDEALLAVFSAAPGTVFFNTNGHAYHGLTDWLKIWAHYRTRIQFLRAGGSGTIRITVRGSMALVTDDHMGRHWTWIGPNQPNILISHPYIRASLVLLREPVGWRVIHAHFSSSRPGPRPDQGGEE